MVYGQAINLSGTTAVGAISADVDVDFDQLLDHLDAAGMMALRSERDRWALALNASYAGLGASGQRFDIDLTQTLLELHLAWRLNQQFELFGGARYQSVDSEISVTRPNGASFANDATEDWTDIVVGARAVFPFEPWRVIAEADVGGFGLTSDLTWSALVAADWSVSNSVGIVFGYRALGTDYQEGSGKDLFKYDVLTAGPLVGVRFTF